MGSTLRDLRGIVWRRLGSVGLGVRLGLVRKMVTQMEKKMESQILIDMGLDKR